MGGFRERESYRNHQRTYVSRGYSPGDPRLPGPKAAEIIAKARELGIPEDGLIGESEIAAALDELGDLYELVRRPALEH